MTDAGGVDENTGELRFGPEFDAETAENIHILSNAQVAVILQASANNAIVDDQEVTDAYNQAQKYVDRFNQMANKEKDSQGVYSVVSVCACAWTRSIQMYMLSFVLRTSSR
jgi:hypothetical protein